MISRWARLSQREQVIVAAAAAFIALLGGVQLLVLPVLNWRASARQAAETAQADYRIVSLAAAKSGPATGAGEAPIRNVLNEAASRLNVPLTYVNALADGGVEMQAGLVSPENAFALFAALEEAHGIEVVAADIARAPDDPNLVRVQATLSR